MLRIKFGMIHLKYGIKKTSLSHSSVNFKAQETGSISNQDIDGTVSSEATVLKINLFNKKILKKLNKPNRINST